MDGQYKVVENMLLDDGPLDHITTEEELKIFDILIVSSKTGCYTCCR